MSDQTNSKMMMVCNTKCMSCLFFRKPMFKHLILVFHCFTPDVFLSKVIRSLSIMAKNASYHISLEFTVGDYAQFQRKNLSKSVSLIHTSYVQMLRCCIDVLLTIISISQTRVQYMRSQGLAFSKPWLVGLFREFFPPS